MNTNAQFDRDLEEWLEAAAGASAPAGFHATVMDRARTLRQRPAWTTTATARRFGRGRGVTLLAAAAAVFLVGGALAAGSGVLPRHVAVPAVPAPSFRVAVASPATSPSPTAVRIMWTQASLSEDWPGTVRTEPTGGPILVPILFKSVQLGACPGPNCAYNEIAGHLADPTGDTGSDAVPWGDIKNVGLYGFGVDIDFVSGHPHDLDPRQQWWAYGLVVDADGDGVPDWRYGIDNVPVGTPSHCDGGVYTTRRWRTDLHTGRTDWLVCLGLVGPAPDGIPPADGAKRSFIFDSRAGSWDVPGVSTGISFGSDTTRGETGALPKRFYAWASEIQDGRVVASDYAPDAGWLVPSPNAKP